MSLLLQSVLLTTTDSSNLSTDLTTQFKSIKFTDTLTINGDVRRQIGVDPYPKNKKIFMVHYLYNNSQYKCRIEHGEVKILPRILNVISVEYKTNNKWWSKSYDCTEKFNNLIINNNSLIFTGNHSKQIGYEPFPNLDKSLHIVYQFKGDKLVTKILPEGESFIIGDIDTEEATKVINQAKIEDDDDDEEDNKSKSGKANSKSLKGRESEYDDDIEEIVTVKRGCFGCLFAMN